MKQVFVYSNGNQDKPYTVIFKDSGKKQELNDVMLFNAEYKRYQEIKGWHGIVSEEINFSIIELVKGTIGFKEVKTVGNLYYPRFIKTQDPNPVKTLDVIRFLPSKIVGRNKTHVSNSILTEWCKPWKLEELEEYREEDEDYRDEEE